MNQRQISLELPPELLMAMHDLATEQEGTVSHVVQDLLTEHLASKKGARPAPAPTNEKLVMALQKLLFRDMAEATSWEDLDQRMRKHGYFLKIAWGGLSIHTETSGKNSATPISWVFPMGLLPGGLGPASRKTRASPDLFLPYRAFSKTSCCPPRNLDRQNVTRAFAGVLVCDTPAAGTKG